MQLSDISSKGFSRTLLFLYVFFKRFLNDVMHDILWESVT